MSEEPLCDGGPSPQPGAGAGGSAVSTVKRTVVDSSLRLPARSMATMRSVCSPFSVYLRVRPGAQSARGSSSKAHWKAAPSSERNSNHGVPLMIDAVGGTLHLGGERRRRVDREAVVPPGRPVTPSSVARTDRVYSPSTSSRLDGVRVAVAGAVVPARVDAVAA